MDASTLWWVIAGILVAVELATGTFYLLMLAVGGVAGAIAAHAGLSESLQVGLAAVVGGLCAGGWYMHRRKPSQAGADMAAEQDPSLSLDLGQTVQVPQWHSDGTALVQYRGAQWQARLQHPLAPPGVPETGTYRICAIQGSLLLLTKD